jgi:hypothetical protein
MRFNRRMFGLVAAAGLTVTIALVAPRQATAHDDGPAAGCTDATLTGVYGATVSGIRAIGPNATEQFAAVGLRTYDGRGSFEDVASFHGQVLPALRSGHVGGTYHVNADCTGTSIFQPPAPFPAIESDFVVLGRGRSVHEVVMSPQPNVVTAFFERR